MDTRTLFAIAIIVFAVTDPSAPTDPEGQLTSFVSIDRPSASDSINGYSPRIVFHGATDFEAERMTWAIGRFDELGLELPRLEIRFAQDCQDRFGAWGRIQYDSNPWRIEVCTTAAYLHELAHAWDRWNLNDAERRVFMDLRGLKAWRGNDTPWAERGVEELASLVADIVGQGVRNYRSGNSLADLRDFARVTGVVVPVVDRVGTIDSRFEAPLY